MIWTKLVCSMERQSKSRFRVIKCYQTSEKEQVTSAIRYRELRAVETRYERTGANGLLRAS